MTFEPIASPSTQDPGDLVAKLGVNLVDSGAIDRRTLDRARYRRLLQKSAAPPT
jgi:hypothetical protein